MKITPRISTRGYYDLHNGKTLKTNSYYLYPKKDFKKLLENLKNDLLIESLFLD